MDIKEISKKYNRAKTYRDGIKTPFFRQLKKYLETEVDIVGKLIIYPGYETPEKEMEAKITARAYRKLLVFLEGQSRTAERLKTKLDDYIKDETPLV